MSDKPEWEKEFTKKNFLDRFHLSIQEISEMGVAWIIMAAVILYLTGLNLDLLFIYLIVFGISFFVHEMSHKLTAIKFGARANFRISKEGLMLLLVSLIIGFPILAVGAVFWWGEAAYSTRLRGRVSAAGPISNIVLVGIFFIIEGIGWIILLQQTDLGIFLILIGTIGVWLNTFLGLFNLLPIGMLDGAKVLAWDGRIWIALIGIFIVIGFFGRGFFL
ncbi:MAG: M50 family metallopeptidase [Candidatus Hodarchaeales archaeon]|jgi:Zn-dependent protease